MSHIVKAKINDATGLKLIINTISSFAIFKFDKNGCTILNAILNNNKLQQYIILHADKFQEYIITEECQSKEFIIDPLKSLLSNGCDIVDICVDNEKNIEFYIHDKLNKIIKHFKPNTINQRQKFPNRELQNTHFEYAVKLNLENLFKICKEIHDNYHQAECIISCNDKNISFLFETGHGKFGYEMINKDIVNMDKDKNSLKIYCSPFSLREIFNIVNQTKNISTDVTLYLKNNTPLCLEFQIALGKMIIIF